jgi:hypothetical protein
VITHGIDEFRDTHFVLRRTWCGIDLAPSDPRPSDNEPVDCMTCLVLRARRDAWNQAVVRVLSINSDGSVVMEVP